MADVRYQRLERYETWAAECEMLARVMTDCAKRQYYERLAAYYEYLALSFREALTTHSAALAKMTMH